MIWSYFEVEVFMERIGEFLGAFLNYLQTGLSTEGCDEPVFCEETLGMVNSFLPRLGLADMVGDVWLFGKLSVTDNLQFESFDFLGEVFTSRLKYPLDVFGFEIHGYILNSTKILFPCW